MSWYTPASIQHHSRYCSFQIYSCMSGSSTTHSLFPLPSSLFSRENNGSRGVALCCALATFSLSIVLCRFREVTHLSLSLSFGPYRVAGQLQNFVAHDRCGCSAPTPSCPTPRRCVSVAPPLTVGILLFHHCQVVAWLDVVAIVGSMD